MASSTKNGPYGCDEGAFFDAKKVPKQLLNIDVWSNDGPDGKINAISFLYKDEKGDTVQIGPVGTLDGIKHPIPIAQGEYLTLVSGYYSPCITTPNFNTSKPATHGPYGRYPNIGGTSFNIDVNHDDSIIALFGRSDDQIRAIGVHVGPRA